MPNFMKTMRSSNYNMDCRLCISNGHQQNWHFSLRALEGVLCHISDVELLQAVLVGIHRWKNLVLHRQPSSLILALAFTSAASILTVSWMTCYYAMTKVDGLHGYSGWLPHRRVSTGSPELAI